MAQWLFKTDPGTYAWDDLVRAERERWDGVANPLALKHLRSVKKGDTILIYHTGKEKAVRGLAQAASAPYPDPGNAKLYVVDIEPVEPLEEPVTLARIKQNKKLKNWELVRLSRLSVMPASPEQWEEVLRLSRPAQTSKAGAL